VLHATSKQTTDFTASFFMQLVSVTI